MAKTRLPRFDFFEPELSLFQKFRARRVRAYNFLLEANIEQLSGLCDVWFNHTSQGAVRYSPISSLVKLTFINNSCSQGICPRETWERGNCPDLPDACSRLALLDTYDKELGTVKFNQLFITVFVETPGDSTVYKFTPYRFIDSGLLMIRSRELLGLPDAHVAFDFPMIRPGNSEETGFYLGCNMKMQGKIDPNPLGIAESIPDEVKAVLQPQGILSIQPADVQGGHEARSEVWTSAGKVLSGIQDHLFRVAPPPGANKLKTSPLFNNPEAFALFGKWLNLRQYRTDAAEGEQVSGVSYQGILEYEFKELEITGGGLIDREFEISFPHIEENLIDRLGFVNNLGVKAQNRVQGAYWIDFDYELSFLRNVWVAET